MILIVGPVASGKRTYAHSLGYDSEQMSADVHSDASVVYDVQEAVRAFLAESPDAQSAIDALLPALQDREVVIAAEVGSGVIPLERADRLFRETAGRLNNLLARQADTVVRMVWGIPQIIKRPLPVIIVRHAQTEGNLTHRYIGRTDEPLCEAGEASAREAAAKPPFADSDAPVVFVSPMLRARQTAGILYPHARQIVVDELREMDFGDFEGKTACEMIADAAYIDWVDAGAVDDCPNGEGRDGFTSRSVEGFKSAVLKACELGLSQCVIVAHGGTVMGVMSALTDDPKDYFGWHVENCHAVRALCNTDTWHLSEAEVLG